MEKERVELHVHTKMSAMDGVTSVTDFINRAAQWRHPAIAITDHGVVQAFPEAMQAVRQCRKQGYGLKILYGIEAYYVDDVANQDHAHRRPFHLTILARNRAGLKNLYQLVSWSHLHNFYRKPRITKSKLLEHREGLFLGSACDLGELYRAVVDGRPWEDLCAIARFYDFLEIQPLGNNEFMMHCGYVSGEEQIREFNRIIVRLGKELNIPVCATGDVHFLDPEDEQTRCILMAAQGYADASGQPPLYFRSTREMLEEFAYLGEEKAYEVVVENTNWIADQIQNIEPIPAGTFYPHLDGAEEQLDALVRSRANALYGDPLPPVVRERLEQELSVISKQEGAASLYWIAHLQVYHSMEHGYRVMARGAAGSSFISWLAGISEINPLVPHYRCPHCRYTEFFTHEEVNSGFDLPQKSCPACGHPLERDGQEIPWESFLGFCGDKVPDFDLNFASEYYYQGRPKQVLKSLFGKDRVIKAGTISTIAERTALRYIQKHEEETGLDYSPETLESLTKGLVGVKRSTGQHPGGFVILPENREAEDFTPLQHPGDDPEAGISTHFDFHSLHDVFLKLDDLGHDVPTICRYLEKYTGIPITDADVSDPAVYRLFTSPEPLGITAEQSGFRTGALSLPEYGTPFVEEMLTACRPEGFADLVKISGLSHGTGTWLDNAEKLLETGVCPLSELISSREDVYNTLRAYGLDATFAFRMMELVRKGKAGKHLHPEEEARMREHGISDWYIDSCKKIRYLFPKAHAGECALMAVRLGWYKLYHPVAYYAAYLTGRDAILEEEAVMHGAEACRTYIDRIRERAAEDLPDEDCRMYLSVAYEALLRGIRFLPASLGCSAASAFVPEDGAIRLPLTSVKELTREQAERIESARVHGGLSREALYACGLSGETVDALLYREI